MNDLFHKISTRVSGIVGSPAAFMLAIAIIVFWWTTGPAFGYSDTWQLIINTGTTIVTFLMVFLIQNTQNRDARAIHLKLDELLRNSKGSRSSLVDVEELSDQELNKLQAEFRTLHEHYKEALENRKTIVSKK